MRRAGVVVLLTAVWCLLWGAVTPADLAGGLLAGLVVQAFVPASAVPGVRMLRPWPAVGFAARFLVDLVVASLTVARQAFWRRGRIRPQVVTVNLASRDASVLTVVGNTITLTPGTLTLEIDPARGTLLVHALHTHDGREIVEAAERYEHLVSAMLGTPGRSPA